MASGALVVVVRLTYLGWVVSSMKLRQLAGDMP